MLENFETMQAFADVLKKVVLDMTDIHIDARLEAINTIQRFERCRWHRIAMTDAINETQPSFTITGEAIELHASESQFLQSIEEIYHKYSQHIDCDEILDEIFSMDEAAAYLDIAKDTMYKYVTRQKRVRGKMIGKSMDFTRQQLDNFRDSDLHSLGRPPETMNKYNTWGVGVSVSKDKLNVFGASVGTAYSLKDAKEMAITHAKLMAGDNPLHIEENDEGFWVSGKHEDGDIENPNFCVGAVLIDD